MHRSRSHDAVIRVYDDAGNVIETHAGLAAGQKLKNQPSRSRRAAISRPNSQRVESLTKQTLDGESQCLHLVEFLTNLLFRCHRLRWQLHYFPKRDRLVEERAERFLAFLELKQLEPTQYAMEILCHCVHRAARFP